MKPRSFILSLLLVVAVATSAMAAFYHRQAGGPAPTPGTVMFNGPYMGVNVYWFLGGGNSLTVTETGMHTIADFMVSSGLKAAGYTLLTLDAGWWNGARDTSGNIVAPAAQFPTGMPALANYLHADGLKAGIYTDIGPSGCLGANQGSFNHFTQDVASFASWGFDAIKAAACGLGASNDGLPNYQQFSAAVAASTRTMQLYISNTSQTPEWIEEWGYGQSLGTTWKVAADLIPSSGTTSWANVDRVLEANKHPGAAGVGHYNDADCLAIGSGSGLTDTEAQTQMAMWAITMSPLMICSDPRNLTTIELNILKNGEVIAIDQDGLGAQGYQIKDTSGAEVWSRVLSGGGSRAVALVNTTGSTASISFVAADVGLSGSFSARDVINHTNLGSMSNYTASSVPSHGVVLLKLTGGTENNTAIYQIQTGGNGGTAPFAADSTLPEPPDGLSTFAQSLHYSGTIDTTGVTNPAPQAVYQDGQFASLTPAYQLYLGGNYSRYLGYFFPNLSTAMPYLVRLHFAENTATGAGQRLFNIRINGQLVASNFDIFATAGAAHKATVQEFTVTPTAGFIGLSLEPGATGAPIISGIEVLQNGNSGVNITGITVGAPGSFTCNTASTVGPITIQGSGAVNNARLSLDSTSLANGFSLSSPTVPSNLLISATPVGCPQTYNVILTATLAGATGSGVPHTVSVVGSSGTSLTSVTLGPPSSFTCNTSGFVGEVTVQGTGNFGAATLSLSGADVSAGGFTLGNTVAPAQLIVGSSPTGCPRTYNINIIATLVGATGCDTSTDHCTLAASIIGNSSASLTGITLSNTSFTCGVSGPVGAVSVQGTGNLSGTTLALDSTSISNGFSLSSTTVPSNLVITGTPTGCGSTTYNVQITATKSGATNSPLPVTIPVNGVTSSGVQGSVPSGLPSHLGIGVFNEYVGGNLGEAGSSTNHVAWMTGSGVPWDYRYQYFNTGWDSYNSPAGVIAALYTQESLVNGYIPVYTWEQALYNCSTFPMNATNLSGYFTKLQLLLQNAVGWQYWNIGANSGGLVTFSADYKTATLNSSGNQNVLLGQKHAVGSGKWIITFKAGSSWSSGSDAFGLASGGTNTNANGVHIGGGGGDLGIYSFGVYTGGAQVTAAPSFSVSPNDVVDLAVDFSAHTIDYRKNGGNWAVSGTATPGGVTTVSAGFDFFTTGFGPWGFAVSLEAINNSAIIVTPPTTVSGWQSWYPSWTAVVDLDPDDWSFMQQCNGNDPTVIPASVTPASGNTYTGVNLSGLPNNARGTAQAIKMIRDAFAPNILLAWHSAYWAPNDGYDPTNRSYNGTTTGTAVGTFYNGLQTNFDAIIVDISDADSAYKVIARGNDSYATPNCPSTACAWWDDAAFTSYSNFLQAINQTAKKRIFVWQIPQGNTRQLAQNNTKYHFQDNKVEEWLGTGNRARLVNLTNTGVIGLLFGSGQLGAQSGVACSSSCGGTGNACYTSCSAACPGGTPTCATTGNEYFSQSSLSGSGGYNPSSIADNANTGNTQATTTGTATVSDDDGGYFRAQAGAYYANTVPLP